MNFLLTDPLGQGIVVPLLVSGFIGLWMRMGGGGAFAARFGGLGIGIGFLVAYALVQGIQPFPPAGSLAKVFYVVAIGMAVGLVADLGPAERHDAHLFAALLPLGALVWLAIRPLGAPSWSLVGTLLLLYLASMLVYWRVAATVRGADQAGGEAAALFPAILVLVAAVPLGLVALMGGSAVIATLGFAVAAGAGGCLGVQYLAYLARGRVHGLGSAGIFGSAGALLALAYVLVLFNEGASRVALALLLLVFVADLAARRRALALAPRWLRPVAYGALVAVPAAASFAYAYLVLGQRLAG
jgi:hypothetical protein